MRNLNSISGRVTHPFLGGGDDKCGAFNLNGPCGQDLTVIASNGQGWDHVSVSMRNRCPNWQEMDFVKKVFFKDDEMAIQYHMPKSDHINIHNFCLHLWKPHNFTMPTPPKEFV